METLDDPDDLREKYVIPFSMDLMAHNSLNAGPELLIEVRDRATELSAAEVERLLLASWRSRVLGAWYFIANPQPELVDLVHFSLRSAQGRLTAPPLIAAAVICVGKNSLEAIADYARSDLENQWDAEGTARAGAQILSERLGTKNPLSPSSSEELRTMQRLMEVAQLLQEQL